MADFMGNDFLLETATAKRLFTAYAKDMPIFDYHCHLEAKTIYEDTVFESLGSLWLFDDHYKWRLMRAAGIEEKYISGTASYYDKFLAFAKTAPLAIGNPVYEWSHLELQRYFGIHEPLTPASAPSIWKKAQSVIDQKKLSPRKMIVSSNVKTVCTTEDPVLDFKYHELLAKEFKECRVLPAWRPDAVLKINQNGFPDYISTLSAASGIKIGNYSSLKKALDVRMKVFNEHGCIASDHDIAEPVFLPVSDGRMEELFAKRMSGKMLDYDEYHAYRTTLLLYLAGCYKKYGWAMEMHIGCVRDQNLRKVQEIGQARGFDTIGDVPVAAGIGDFLDALERKQMLPKTILFCMNAKDNWVLSSLANTFQGEGMVSKMQFGAAWWMQDHKYGMEEQLAAFANNGLLAGFIGMLTDSRSFLSYSRHEYFRRILCNYIGKLVEQGEYPDCAELGSIVQNICYNNAVQYFSKGVKG